MNNNKLKKIDNLDSLVFLKKLELRTNRIEKWENLDGLKNLAFLTLSSNLITKIDAISSHPLLQELGLFGNHLGIKVSYNLGDDKNEDQNMLEFEDFLNQLNVKLPKLEKMFIGGNYFSKIKSK